MPRSQIVYEAEYEAWAIHCADCGEFIEHAPSKPNHHTFTWADDLETDGLYTIPKQYQVNDMWQKVYASLKKLTHGQEQNDESSD